MNCFFRALKTTTNLLIALALFAGGHHFAYAAQTQDNVQTSPQQTAPKNITIIAQHFSSHYSTIAKSLSLSSLANDYKVTNISLEDWKRQKPQSELIISLGPTPLAELLKSEHKEPVLAALITFQDWKELTNKYSPPQSVSAIFYDPDPKRQIILGKLLLPLSKSVGVMYSMNTPYFLEEYKNSLESLGLTLQTTQIKQTTEVAGQFPALAQQADFIIAQPDPVIYNSQTLPRVLLSSYRQRKVIIGYSTGLVNAGAVATTYTTPEMLVTDIRESALDILNNKFTNFTRHSKYYDIKYNNEVARSLELETISKQQLQSQIDKLITEVDRSTDSKR